MLKSVPWNAPPMRSEDVMEAANYAAFGAGVACIIDKA